MVGNDVVDLRDADAASEYAPRFDARVFCDEERASLCAGPERARRRWQLWAAKEAAYKAAVRQDPHTVFSPSRFRVHLPLQPDIPGDTVLHGLVETPVGDLPVRVFEEAGAVHALVCTDPARTVAGMTRIAINDADPDGPGREVRRLAGRRMASLLEVPEETIEIRKRGRIPELWVSGEPSVPPSLLSLSHHGDVVGFACEVSFVR